jgi:hypothetical protein
VKELNPAAQFPSVRAVDDEQSEDIERNGHFVDGVREGLAVPVLDRGPGPVLDLRHRGFLQLNSREPRNLFEYEFA